jgi:hypothetical protein
MRIRGVVMVVAAALIAAARTAQADPEAPTPQSPSPSETQDELKAIRAELDELRAAADAGTAGDASLQKEPVVRVFGFIDMGLQKLWSTGNVVGTNAATFVLGNINLYFDFHPAEDWSSLIEVRLTNYPGDAASLALDPANGTGDDTVRWGGIVLERAYMQWQKHDTFGVRVGEILTPYGIWNVDHGSPTLIAIERPEFVTAELWPAHQLGIEAFGRFDRLLPDPWQLEYHGYVSNGRTPGLDPTDDKMLGGRIIASRTRPYPMAFGLSVMDGSHTETDVSADVIPVATNVAYEEMGIAADASIDLGHLRLRSELITRRIHYTPGEHALTDVPGVFAVNAIDSAGYVLAAYRIPSTRFEPYLYGEGYRVPTPEGDLQLTGSIGFNTYFTPAIQLKLQYSHTQTYLTDGLSLTREPSSEDFLAAKLVMGF